MRRAQFDGRGVVGAILWLHESATASTQVYRKEALLGFLKFRKGEMLQKTTANTGPLCPWKARGRISLHVARWP